MVPKVKLVGCAVGVTQAVFGVAVIEILSILILGLDPVVPPILL